MFGYFFQKAEFLQGPSTENASVQSLFSRILEEETGEAISQFEVALRQLTSDPGKTVLFSY